MELILLRHTRVDLPPGICYGISDVAPAPSFPEELTAVRNRLPKCWQRIVSSPLQRCRRLAEGLKRPDTPLRCHDDLRELNFGSWELRPWSSLTEAEYRAWGADWVATAPPGGESLRQLAVRVLAALEEERAPDNDLLMVSHGGPIRAILGHCLGLTLREAMALPAETGSHHHLRHDGTGWQLVDRR